MRRRRAALRRRIRNSETNCHGSHSETETKWKWLYRSGNDGLYPSKPIAPRPRGLGLAFHLRSFHLSLGLWVGPYSPLYPGFGTLCDHGVFWSDICHCQPLSENRLSCGIRQGSYFLTTISRRGHRVPPHGKHHNSVFGPPLKTRLWKSSECGDVQCHMFCHHPIILLLIHATRSA